MSRQIAIALAALAAMIGATLAADAVVATPTVPSAAFTEQVPVSSGTWYCVPLARADETASLVIAAVGEDGSRVSVQHFRDGKATFEDERRELAPNETATLEIDGGDTPPAVVVRWSGGPVVVSWTVDADDAQRLGASCSASPAPRWLMSGAVTTVGSSSRIYLFNPFETDAVARVAFATPEGRVNLVSSENVSVPARQVVAVGINELQPEQPDLGIIVEVEAGRVIATGLQRFGQPDLPDIQLEGAELPSDPTAPEGRTMLHAEAADTTTAGFAYAASGERTTSWITVLNPNSQPAQLSVTASDQVDGVVSQELTVGPESVARIDLDGASSMPDFGVVLRATNEVTFVASAFTVLTGDDRFVSSVPGVTAIDETSAQAAAPSGTAPELALYNPGDVAATASIKVGGSAPGDWSTQELGPGEMKLLPFADAGVDGGGPVTVTADQPLYSALRLADPDSRTRSLLTMPLLPATAWTGSSDALAPQRDRTLETRPVDFPLQEER